MDSYTQRIMESGNPAITLGHILHRYRWYVKEVMSKLYDVDVDGMTNFQIWKELPHPKMESTIKLFEELDKVRGAALERSRARREAEQEAKRKEKAEFKEFLEFKERMKEATLSERVDKLEGDMKELKSNLITIGEKFNAGVAMVLEYLKH